MTATQDQNRTALRRFGRWLVLPLLLAMLVFLQTGLREAVDLSAWHRPEIATAATAADLLLPETTALPRFLPQSRATAVVHGHVAAPLGIQIGWNARAPPPALV